MCLFDGRRGHQVQAFDGAHYSLVYFTQQRYATASRESLKTLAKLGAPNPSPQLLYHFDGLLAPPRGYDGGMEQKSIRRAFCGSEELPQYISSSSCTWYSLSISTLDATFSYVISPEAMSIFCAICRKTNASCWRDGSWKGTIVDPLGARPKGMKAFTHYKLWLSSSGARVQDWMFSSVSFLLNPVLEAWQWGRSLAPPRKTWQTCRGHRLLVSRQPVCLDNVNVRIEIVGDAPTDLVLGLSDAECPAELMRLFLDKKNRQQRGPKPDVIEVDLNLYYISLGATTRKKCFGWNGRPISASAPPPRLRSLNGAIVTFGLYDQGLFVMTRRTPRLLQVEARLPRSVAVQTNFPHYCVAIVPGEREPTLSLTPFLNIKRGDEDAL